MPEQHDMVLTRSDESGAEEWSCPRCGRRLLLRWPPPRVELIVLDEGDPRVPHAGAKGVAAMTAKAVRDAEARDADVRNDGVTATELRWLRDNGIAWHGPAS